MPIVARMMIPRAWAVGYQAGSRTAHTASSSQLKVSIGTLFQAARRSWHMQDEGVIDCPQILRIGRDDMQIALPCADRNRDIDDIGMT
jgi:hypothetical protein